MSRWPILVVIPLLACCSAKKKDARAIDPKVDARFSADAAPPDPREEQPFEDGVNLSRDWFQTSNAFSKIAGDKNSFWKIWTVVVCWEELRADQANARLWIRDAVAQSWESSCGLRFVGWQQCQPPIKAVRIRIKDTTPHTLALGSHLVDVRDGVVINATFKNWGNGDVIKCAQTPEVCTRIVTVHEFGHVLGFVHENNRDDRPIDCKAEVGGTSGDVKLCPYDPQSVMNYCNKDWNGNGVLSDCDRSGAAQVYGALE